MALDFLLVDDDQAFASVLAMAKPRCKREMSHRCASCWT